MRILLTGATGFIGKAVARAMVVDGHAVAAIIRDVDRAALLPSGVSPLVIDGTAASVVRSMADSRPDLVIHLATNFVAQHRPEDVDDLIVSNVQFGAQVLEAMRICGVLRILNFGTSFQHVDGPGYDPASLYAATKQAFEAIAAFYVRVHAFSMLTLKLSDTYGPGDTRGKVISLLLRTGRTGGRLAMSPGEQRLSFLHVDDAAAAVRVAIERLMQADQGAMESFAVRGEEIVSLRELAVLIERISGDRIDIGWGERPYRDREVMQPWLGPLLPGWRSTIDLRQGIGMIADV